jgi:hypothetical protein
MTGGILTIHSFHPSIKSPFDASSPYLHDVPASSMASSAFICEGVHNFSGQRRLYEQHGGSHRSSSPGAVMSFYWGS